MKQSALHKRNKVISFRLHYIALVHMQVWVLLRFWGGFNQNSDHILLSLAQSSLNRSAPSLVGDTVQHAQTYNTHTQTHTHTQQTHMHVHAFSLSHTHARTHNTHNAPTHTLSLVLHSQPLFLPPYLYADIIDQHEVYSCRVMMSAWKWRGQLHETTLSHTCTHI